MNLIVSSTRGADATASRQPPRRCDGDDGSALARQLGYRSEIDGLRAVAVVLVILFHFGIDGFRGGYIGVDVFFVISGFLITQLIHDDIVRGRFSFVRFYERRIRRIVPALFLVMALSLVAGWFILLPLDYRSLAHSALATLGFVSNIWFWQETENYFARAAEYSPLLHTWSLAVEEQFYIVFPPLLLLLFRSLRPRSVVTALVFVCAVSFAYSIVLVAHEPQAAFYLALGRAWELGIGALLALGLVPRLEARWMREILAATGLATIILAAILFRHSTPFPGYAALAPCLGAAAIIAAEMPRVGRAPTLTARALSLRPIVFIGLISYSLYLWHWPILVYLRHIYADHKLPMTVTLAAIAASLVAATLSWAVVERPFRARDRLRRPVVWAGWAVASVVIGVSAVFVSVQGGLPDRDWSPVALGAEAASRDENPRADECFEVDPMDGLCSFGVQDSGDADLFFWGDSHANALMPGMDTAARAAGMGGVFAALGSCPPLLDFMQEDRAEARDCRRFNAAVMAALRDRDDIRTVVLTARWAVYADHEDTDVADPEAMFEQALLDTVGAIRATGRTVLIVGAVPEPGWDVPHKVVAAERWAAPLPPVPDIAAARATTARVDQIFARAAERPGVRFIPLVDALCRPECAIMNDGRPIFTDTDHVTATAARTLLAPVLLEALVGEADQPLPRP